MIISNREKALYWVVFLLLLLIVIGATWYFTSGKIKSSADTVTPTTTTTKDKVEDTTLTSPILSLQSGWNLKSIPYILSPSDGKTVLLGLDTREAYSMDSSGKWSSLYQSGNITPGQAIWIRSDLGQSYQLPVQATAVDSSKSFTISLNKGWNAIGNPFNKDITWNPTVKTSKGITSFKKAVDAKILTVGYTSDTTGKEYKTIQAGDIVKASQGMLIKAGGENIDLIVNPN
jgi:hypothetical protein